MAAGRVGGPRRSCGLVVCEVASYVGMGCEYVAVPAARSHVAA